MDDLWGVAAWLVTWGVTIAFGASAIAHIIDNRDTRREIERINRGHRGDGEQGS